MRSINLSLDAPAPIRVVAVQGEHIAAALRIDVSDALAHYPNAWFSVLVKREGDASPYISEAVLHAEKSTVTYFLTRTDTAKPGQLAIEVQARDGNENALIKSRAYSFLIADSICSELSNPEVPKPDWTDEVIEAAKRSVIASAHALEYYQGAAAIAASLSDSAASASRLSLFVTVDANGHVIVSSDQSQITSATINENGSLIISLEVA